jgi:hypothetical protein
LGVEEEASEFCFGGGADNDSQDVAVDMDGAVGGWWCRGGRWFVHAFTEKKYSTRARSRLRLRQVGRVAVHVEDHIAGRISDSGLGMSGSVVEELIGGPRGHLGGFRLGGGDGSEGDKHRGVDGTGVIQKKADDLLDEVHAIFAEQGRRVDRGRELRDGVVLGLGPGVAW